MSAKLLPDRDYVRQLLDYNAETGVFTWHPRSRELFPSLRAQAVWNVRYAGKQAGCITKFGYRIINIHCSLYMAHRLAWLLVYGEPVPSVLDHMDRNGLNNRIENLREATELQNHANSGARKNSKLGVKGVHRWQGKYRAVIETNRKTTHLGMFDTVDEAARAYRSAAVQMHGDFADGGSH